MLAAVAASRAVAPPETSAGTVDASTGLRPLSSALQARSGLVCHPPALLPSLLSAWGVLASAAEVPACVLLAAPGVSDALLAVLDYLLGASGTWPLRPCCSTPGVGCKVQLVAFCGW